MTEIFLCAQCAIHVVWPKELKRADVQPGERRKCKLCGRLCYGTLYDLKKEDKDA